MSAIAFFLDSGSFLLTSTAWLNSSKAETHTHTKKKNHTEAKSESELGWVGSPEQYIRSQKQVKQSRSQKNESCVYLWGSMHTFQDAVSPNTTRAVLHNGHSTGTDPKINL